MVREAMLPLRIKSQSNKEYENIIAFIILFLIYLSLPSLFFILVLTVIYNISYIIKFFNTRNIMFMLFSILLAILNICLTFCLRLLIKWLRT